MVSLPFPTSANTSREASSIQAGVDCGNSQKRAIRPGIAAEAGIYGTHAESENRSPERAQKNRHQGQRHAEECSHHQHQHDVSEPQIFLLLAAQAVESLAHGVEEPAPHQSSRDGARDRGEGAFQIDVPMPENPTERPIIHGNEKAEHQSQADSENSYGVGNAPVEEVRKNENDQQHAEQRVFDEFRPQPVDVESQNQDQGRQRFHRGIKRRNRRMAIAATPAQNQITDQRDIVVPTNRVIAARAMRAGKNNRFSLGAGGKCRHSKSFQNKGRKAQR